MFSNQTRSIHPLIPTIAILIAAVAWQAGANNASRPPAQDTSVVTVDIVEVIDKLVERGVREDELEANKDNRQAQLEEIADQIRILEADLKVSTRGTDDYKDKIRQAMEIQAVYKARGEALNQILSIDRGNVSRELYQKINDAVNRIADREGYDIVLFDDSLFPIQEDAPYQEVFRSIITRNIIYHHNSTDITDQVITLMNNEFTAP
jgi:Skp family chaperone for outer membrane proteins